MSNVEFYRCEKCGNIAALIKKGGGTLTCCGQAMKKLEANSTDAAKEKHVPIVTAEGGKVKVSVGSTLHPMLEEHYIEWIAIVSDEKIELKYLKPGDKPIVEFEEVQMGTVVYAYCNLHGLWKTDLTAENFVIPYEAACSAEFKEGCILPE